MDSDPPIWLPTWLAYLHARYNDAAARAADPQLSLPARAAASATVRYFDAAIADAELLLPIWPAPPRRVRRFTIRLT